MKSLLSEMRLLIAKVDAGEITEGGFTSRCLMIQAKHKQKVMKQSENSNLPTEVRMGVAKKGYTRQINLQ